jgi:hypothetical protein
MVQRGLALGVGKQAEASAYRSGIENGWTIHFVMIGRVASDVALF